MGFLVGVARFGQVDLGVIRFIGRAGLDLVPFCEYGDQGCFGGGDGRVVNDAESHVVYCVWGDRCVGYVAFAAEVLDGMWVDGYRAESTFRLDLP